MYHPSSSNRVADEQWVVGQGMVVPLGGILESSNTPLILGDSFSEPLSGKSARISGAYVEETQVLPHAGGYQALLDAAMLACEIQVLDLLKDYKDCVAVRQSEVPSCPQKQRSSLRDALDGLVKARTRSWAHMIHTAHNLERQRKEAKDLADNGGSIGMLPFPSTGLLVSAVIGMQIPDPGGSDLEVPVLGVEYDGATGQLIPLAGTMEDPDGKGLIPITLGARSIDPLTGEIGPVVGAYIDPQTRIVMPVTQSSGASIRRKPPVELLNALEEELSYRRVHWHHQRQKEEAVFGALKSLLQEISDTKSDWKFEKVAEKVKALENTIDLLQDCAQNEAQRRHTEELHFASIMPTDIVLLVSQVNQEEVEQQLLYLAMAQTFLEKVTQFIQKMHQDEARRRGQLQELLQGVNQQAEEVSRRPDLLTTRTVKILLTQEFQKNMMSRWTALDIVYIRLEHLRDLGELCVLEAKGILFGGLYRFGDYQLIGNRAAGHFHGAPDSTNKKMFPLLKQLISLLEADRNLFLSPDNLNLASRNEKDWAKLLPQCPLFKLLKEINEQLKANQETEELLQAKDHQQCTNQTKAKYQEADRPYIDIVDAQWSCEGKLLPLTLEKISVTELVVYRFGIFIVQLVKRSINAPEINLLLASSLPVNNYTRNAFRNSFFYQSLIEDMVLRFVGAQ
ncbi:uncharacterized protein si:dkey-103g5.4 [Heterodontus francisci]|uniref:uncharacterized protein si:dkey-103g5.4 n=1 Tax=Heterodontus francisci TaxID=7792 RepID=UPI00355B3F3A